MYRVQTTRINNIIVIIDSGSQQAIAIVSILHLHYLIQIENKALLNKIEDRQTELSLGIILILLYNILQ